MKKKKNDQPQPHFFSLLLLVFDTFWWWVLERFGLKLAPSLCYHIYKGGRPKLRTPSMPETTMAVNMYFLKGRGSFKAEQFPASSFSQAFEIRPFHQRKTCVKTTPRNRKIAAVFLRLQLGGCPLSGSGEARSPTSQPGPWDCFRDWRMR